MNTTKRDIMRIERAFKILKSFFITLVIISAICGIAFGILLVISSAPFLFLGAAIVLAAISVVVGKIQNKEL